MSKARKDDNERETVAIEEMIAKGKEREFVKGLEKEESHATELIRTDEDKPIKLSLSTTKLVSTTTTVTTVLAVNPLTALR